MKRFGMMKMTIFGKTGTKMMIPLGKTGMTMMNRRINGRIALPAWYRQERYKKSSGLLEDRQAILVNKDV